MCALPLRSKTYRDGLGKSYLNVRYFLVETDRLLATQTRLSKAGDISIHAYPKMLN